MMKTFYKEKELLSAYIDGELSHQEKELIESRISASLELQKEFADMKKLKELTSSSFERIPEAPFFQTRLNAELNSSKPLISKARKWIPAVGLTVLTAAIMLTLKFYPNLIQDVFEEQKSNLAALYKENLQPLLFAANLTNEDIFNFAFNSELPLDKSDEHFLKLGYDLTGKEYFEIKKSSSSVKENNLENFIQALALDEEQRREMDSIIASYSDELMAQVLVSEKNAIAINPNLWNYQKAIAADLLAFAKSNNEKVYKSIFPVEIRIPDNPQIMHFVRNVKPASDHKYIFFTPDTIFTDTFVFDDRAFRKDMNEMKKDFAEVRNNLVKMNFQIRMDTTFKRLEKDSAWEEDFSVNFDSEKFRVNIPKIVMQKLDINLPDMDSLNALIKDALKSVEVYVNNLPGKQTGKRKFQLEVYGSDSTRLKGYPFDGARLDSIMKYEFQNIDSLKKLYFDSFNFFDDSASKGFNYFFNDSLFYNQNEELRKQMNELKEEMRRFREEMRNLQVDPPARPDTIKPKMKGIEI